MVTTTTNERGNGWSINGVVGWWLEKGGSTVEEEAAAGYGEDML
jgi:hypothetical protein